MTYNPNQPRDKDGEWTTDGGDPHTIVNSDGTHTKVQAVNLSVQSYKELNPGLRSDLRKAIIRANEQNPGSIASRYAGAAIGVAAGLPAAALSPVGMIVPFATGYAGAEIASKIYGSRKFNNSLKRGEIHMLVEDKSK